MSFQGNINIVKTHLLLLNNLVSLVSPTKKTSSNVKNFIKTNFMPKWFQCWIPNPEVPSSNLWVVPRSTQLVIFLSSIKWVPGISREFVVKRKLSPHSSFVALRQLRHWGSFFKKKKKNTRIQKIKFLVPCNVVIFFLLNLLM